MPSRLIFLPIEPYKSRYTQYTSVEDGVYERCFKEAGINFLSIRPDTRLRQIHQGNVLDVVSRTHWSFQQIAKLVTMICTDEIDPFEDVIYLEDFFTPGFEMIPYAQSSKFGSSPRSHAKVFSFCHAQSTDQYDFTAPWEWWMRPLEKMWFNYQETIFCAAREMISQLEDGGIHIYKGNRMKIVPVGHAFHAQAMLDISAQPSLDSIYFDRKNTVVYSSRWDTEKNPNFFMDLMLMVCSERKDIKFAICTGAERVTSNDNELISRLYEMTLRFPKLITIHTDLSLNEYYHILRTSKVQFNCAFQDFISYVLLDATLMGCAPLYPKHLTFPDALEHNEKHLYTKFDLLDAKNKLYALMASAIPEPVSWVYKKYEGSVARMLRVMGFKLDGE